MSSFLEKQSEKSFLIRVRVKPNSKKQDIFIDGDFLTIKVRSKALQNKANIEVLNLLSKKLNISSGQLKFSSGRKSSNKVIQVLFTEDIDEEELMRNLLL